MCGKFKIALKLLMLAMYELTRAKTSIRYDKENDREKRERERKVEGDI